MYRGGEGVVTRSRHCVIWSWSGRPRVSLGSISEKAARELLLASQLPIVKRSTQQFSTLTVSGPSPVCGSVLPHTWLQTRSNPQVQVMDWYACFSLVAQEESWNRFRFDPRRGMANPGLRFFLYPCRYRRMRGGRPADDGLWFSKMRDGPRSGISSSRWRGWVANSAASLLATSAVRSTSPVEKQPVDC